MQTLRWQAPFITVARDHGSGEVVLDEHGRAVVRWGFDDAVDARLARRANVELARLQHAAGAERVFTLHGAPVTWSQGEDFDAYLEPVESASYEPNDVACFTAHQMGSCRMGSDPETSVADGRGELHDTRRLDRGRERVPDRAGRQPDGDDHVARPPHRGGDRSR